MRVELERKTASGTKSVRLITDSYDITQKPGTILAWIKMLRLAERWLREKNKNDSPGNV